jgi:hypothetical protein
MQDIRLLKGRLHPSNFVHEELIEFGECADPCPVFLLQSNSTDQEFQVLLIVVQKIMAFVVGSSVIHSDQNMYELILDLLTLGYLDQTYISILENYKDYKPIYCITIMKI